MGKELLEAKRIEEENERKRFVFIWCNLSVISYLSKKKKNLLYLAFVFQSTIV